MKKEDIFYDIVVVGGGHAGIEAAWISSIMNMKVALVTMNKDTIGRMSCNPAIGGTAKGHLVREIDALGGVMGMIADKSGIMFKMLNKSKGPAAWSPRCQSDRELYVKEAILKLEKSENLDILEDTIIEIETKNSVVSAVIGLSGQRINCKAIIISAGTFLNGKMFVGKNTTIGGRYGEPRVTGLTEILNQLGFKSGRLKTGTPPRLKRESINFDVMEEQKGDDLPQPFSYKTENILLPQISCFMTYTNERTHKALEEGFEDSPLFTGRIKGVGPRYCPSIEDKINRFKDKERHQLFLEPEGLNSNVIYLNGFSSSLPAEIQYKALTTITGFEKVEMIRPGYAIEYDYFPPYQVDLTLETKLIGGLYFAGQINGTSGYEEAAAQGLIAGINAVLKIQQKEPFILKRSDAYIGVLIDDLINKGTEEPYRMFTSRAEYRLLLRQDNADIRLMQKAHKIGTITKEDFDKFNKKIDLINSITDYCEKKKIKPKELDKLKEKNIEIVIDQSEPISKLVRRSELNLIDLLMLSKIELDYNDRFVKEALNQVEINFKYEGYIKRQTEEIDKFLNNENVKIPLSFNYDKIKSISSEAREKLKKIKPQSFGQACRISGIRQTDLAILLIYLK